MSVRETKDLTNIERPYSGAITLRRGIHTLIGNDAAVCWTGGNRINSLLFKNGTGSYVKRGNAC